MKKCIGLMALALMGGLVACASIMHGTRQDVSISSTPSSAAVTIDGEEKGRTPIAADLKRKDKHLIKIDLPGYFPFEMYTTRKVSGWVWGNIVLGGLIGLAIDAISGGIYNIAPDQINAALAKQGISRLDGGRLYILVVLHPDPTWSKIGDLQKSTL